MDGNERTHKELVQHRGSEPSRLDLTTAGSYRQVSKEVPKTRILH